MPFSSRSAFDPTPNALSRALEAAKARGPVLDLTQSNPTAAGIPCDGAAILSALADPNGLLYEPSPLGLSGARQSVAEELSREGPAVDPGRVVLTASTSEAYAFLFKLLCDPGDEVLVPRPSYPLLEILAGFDSVRLAPYPLLYDGRWGIDLGALRAVVRPSTRAILVVNPNNPTGSYLKRDELAALAALDIPIVCDEVFGSFPLDGSPDRVASVLEESKRLVFSLGGLSKLCALPQMKLSWIALGGPAGEVAAAVSRLEWIADAYLSVGTPVQLALPAMLRAGQGSHQAIQARTRANLARLRAVVSGIPELSVLQVEGGWYATLRLPRIQSEELWALELVEHYAVYTHPGQLFDFPDEAYLVLSLLTPEDQFALGVKRIASCVAQRIR